MSWEPIATPPLPAERRRKNFKIALGLILASWVLGAAVLLGIVVFWYRPIQAKGADLGKTIRNLQESGIPTTPEQMDKLSPRPTAEQAAALKTLTEPLSWLDSQELNYALSHGLGARSGQELMDSLRLQLKAADTLLDPGHPACLVPWRKGLPESGPDQLDGLQRAVRLTCVRAAWESTCGHKDDAIERWRRCMKFLVDPPPGTVSSERVDRSYAQRIVAVAVLRAVEETPGDISFHKLLDEKVLGLAEPMDLEGNYRSSAAIAVLFTKQLLGEPGTEIHEESLDKYLKELRIVPNPLRQSYVRAGAAKLLSNIYAAGKRAVRNVGRGGFNVEYPVDDKDPSGVDLSVTMH